MGKKSDGTNEKKRKKFTSLSIPTDVIDAVDTFVRDERFHGYNNRSDFCTEAIRLRVQELMKLYKDTFHDEKY